MGKDQSGETSALAGGTAAQNNGGIRKPSRTIVVEPLLVGYALATVPLLILTQQYVFQQKAKQVAAEHGITNYTVPATSQNPCATGKANMTSPLANYTDQIQKETSLFVIYSNLVASIPALVVTMFLGAYSDKAGRRFAILPPLVGSFMKSAIYVLAVFKDLSVNYLLLGSFIDGLGGGFGTFLLGCFAYIADTTTPDKRTFRITVVEMCMFLSLTLPPLAIGFWIQESGYMLPFLAVFVGQLLAAAYAVFFVPETMMKSEDARFLATSHLKAVFAVFTLDDGTHRRLKLNMILLAFVFFASVSLGGFQVVTLFEMNRPLCWSSKIIGVYMTIFIFVSVLGGAIVSRLMGRRTSDEWILLAGCIAFTLQHFYAGFVQNSAMMMIIPLFAILGILVIPTARSIMSKLVHRDEQGALFGAIACVEIAFSLIGSVFFNLVYSATIHFYTGFVFFVMTFVSVAGCVPVIAMHVFSRKEMQPRGSYSRQK